LGGGAMAEGKLCRPLRKELQGPAELFGTSKKKNSKRKRGIKRVENATNRR